MRISTGIARLSLPTALTALVSAMALMGPLQTQAQQVYRIVGPDGRVTFSDRPPPETTGGKTNPNVKPANAVALPGGANAGAAGGAQLPFELRQVASRYPVTLYTGNNCGPCGSGRAFLTSRGIPFSEKTVTNNNDIEALQRIAGAASLPSLAIGGQQLKGFSETEWGAYLDAAGYPKTSALPAGYKQPAPSPLVAVAAPAVAAPAAAAPEAAPAPQALPPISAPPSNPAGIRF